MARFNYNLQNDPQMALALDTWIPERRRGSAFAVPAGSTFTVANFPAFAAAEVIDSGNNATAAATGDTALGAHIVSVTGTAAADANTIVTATAATRRDWNPWIRFRFATGTSTQWASVRHWIGAWSSDPSALDTLATLSAACFGWDTVVDGTSLAAGTAFWKCNSGNTATQQTTTTDFPITASTGYTAEIRMDTANAQIEFWMASHGIVTSPKTASPLRRVATHATSVPVATTPLLLGWTGKVLATAAAAKRISFGSCEISQD